MLHGLLQVSIGFLSVIHDTTIYLIISCCLCCFCYTFLCFFFSPLDFKYLKGRVIIFPLCNHTFQIWWCQSLSSLTLQVFYTTLTECPKSEMASNDQCSSPIALLFLTSILFLFTSLPPFFLPSSLPSSSLIPFILLLSSPLHLLYITFLSLTLVISLNSSLSPSLSLPAVALTHSLAHSPQHLLHVFQSLQCLLLLLFVPHCCF